MCPVLDVVFATLVVMVLLVGVVVVLVLVQMPWWLMLGLVGALLTLMGMAASKRTTAPAPEEDA